MNKMEITTKPIIPINDCTSGVLIFEPQLGKRYLVRDCEADAFLREGKRVVVGWAEEEVATFFQRCRYWLRTRRWLPVGSKYFSCL